MNIILIIAAILIILLMIMLVIYRRKTGAVRPNYFVFFIIGICWLPLGISAKNPVFSIVGAVFLAIGLAKRKSWEHRPKWSEMSIQERRIKLIAIIVAGLLLIAGLVAFILMR